MKEMEYEEEKDEGDAVREGWRWGRIKGEERKKNLIVWIKIL